MRKIHIVVIIFIAALLALLVQVLFGNFLSARLATLPFMRNLDLFNPRAPIVVTNRETVRVSDANDAVETTNAVKSKLATVVYYEGTGADARVVVSGGALNWTSDGYFVSTSTALAVPNKTYAVILNNGEIFPIKNVYPDTASNLVVLATDARGMATIEPENAKELRPGEKMLMMLNSVGANQTTFLESYVQKFATDVAGMQFNSDAIGRTISIQSVGALTPGHAAINLEGRLAGLWDGTRVISADAVRIFASNFFKDNSQVIRPGFGFSYRQISGSEARALQLVTGAQVTDVAAGGAALAGKLAEGDIITGVNGVKLDDENLLEASLAVLTPGEAVTFAVTRDGELTTVIITPTILE
jgi:S1-C subfamily serine protease